jgi:excisionase family DNA binding protein
MNCVLKEASRRRRQMTFTLLTTTAAAAELGVTPGRVRAMITAGRIKAIRAGRDWLIEPRALSAVRDRKPGRPHAPQTRIAQG